MAKEVVSEGQNIGKKKQREQEREFLEDNKVEGAEDHGGTSNSGDKKEVDDIWNPWKALLKTILFYQPWGNVVNVCYLFMYLMKKTWFDI